MFKGNLPDKCPPQEVEEQDVVLYRLVIPGDAEESFKNHIELFPERENYKNMCEAHGLSFFDNIKELNKLLSKENNEGKAIAKVTIKPNYGVISKKPSRKGHFTLWLYKNFNPELVTVELI